MQKIHKTTIFDQVRGKIYIRWIKGKNGKRKEKRRHKVKNGKKKRKRGKKKICLFKNAIQMIYQIRYIEKRGKRKKKKKRGKKPIFTLKVKICLIFGTPDIGGK